MYAILYHKNCSDGFTSYWAAHKLLTKNGKDVKGMAVTYNENWDALGVPQFIKGCDTLVVDFSFPREYMEGLKIFAKTFHVLDHHDTAEEACKGLDYCTFDRTKSGAMLTWEYLETKPPPLLIQYVQDRDLWLFKLEDSKAISTAINATEKTLDNWHNLNLMMETNRHIITAKGHVLLEEIDKGIEWTLNNASLGLIGGTIVPVINHGMKNASESIGALSKGHSFAAGFYMKENGQWSFSLRSSDKNVHCGQICKPYGGGGHPGAAGFVVNDLSKILSIRCSGCASLASAAFYPNHLCENCSPAKKIYRKAS